MGLVLENKSKFVSLKSILSILSLFFLLSLEAPAQSSRGPITENKIKLIKPYPNPATSYIIFDLQKNHQKGLSIVVFNFPGRKMYEAKNIEEKTTVNLTDFTRGVYIYQLLDPNGRITDTGKFQVSK
jgi:hypothetical protein